MTTAMKRILPILILLLTCWVSAAYAENVLVQEEPVTRVTERKEMVKHKAGVRNIDDCAIVRVYVMPYLPEDLNLQEATSDYGIDKKEYVYISPMQGYVQFYIPINKEDGIIRNLHFRANGFKKPVQVKVKDELKPKELYEATIRMEQEDMVTLKLKTSLPYCDILKEKDKIGTSDDKGNFTITIQKEKTFYLKAKKEGYEQERKSFITDTLSERVYDRKKKIIDYTHDPFMMVKEGATKQQKVVFTVTQEGVRLVAYSQEHPNDSTVINPSSPAITLYPGKYDLVISKPGHITLPMEFEVTPNKATYVEVLEIDPIKGTLKVTVNKEKAEVYIDNKFRGNTQNKDTFHVSLGAHSLTVKKNMFADQNTSFTLTSAQKVLPINVSLSKTNNEWWNSSQYFPHHYLETYYGMGITANKDINHYIGLQYTVIPHTIGANMSLMYGFNNRDIVATVGPALTLTTQRKTDLDLQLMLGAGYASLLRAYGYPRVGTWVLEAGLRFGFENAITGYRFSWWSIYMGAKYYDKKVVPTLGISLMPFGLFALGADYFTDETDHSSFFFEPTVGYAVKSRDCMIGATFAWQGYNTGFYTSFAYGVLEGNISAIAGPAFHLTPDLDVFDLTLYGGIGYGRTAYGDNCLAGDFGLRFGFSHSDFSWWDVTLGCTSFGGEWVPSIGISWGLVGTIATAGVGAIFYNY